MVKVIQENKTYLAIDFKNQALLDGSIDEAKSLSSTELPIVKAYIDNRLQKIRNQFNELIVATVFLLIDSTVEKTLRNTVEITIHLKGKELYAEARNEDLYYAIDTAVSKLEHQVAKHKEKTQDHHHKKLPDQEF